MDKTDRYIFLGALNYDQFQLELADASRKGYKIIPETFMASSPLKDEFDYWLFFSIIMEKEDE